MRRAALGAAALAITSGAALAYIPSISTLFRRAAIKSDDVDRSRDVTLKGTLIYRRNQTMIETKPEWIHANEKTSAPAAVPQAIALGRQTLTGEIVDSKCFMGVMNPGQLAPHRACDALCSANR